MKESNKKWKFGIVGCGMIADFHALAIASMENAQLVAVYGRNMDRASAFGARHHCNCFTDFDEFLSSNTDIVTIATPSGAHLEPALAAAKSGKHIICEKPLEISEERILRMITGCRDEGVILSGIFNRRFNPAVFYLKEAIEEGRFGTIALADAQVKWYRDQAYYDSGQWRGTLKLDGGGALMNQSIHTIDLLLYLMGPVKRLAATMACLTHKNIEVEDTAVAILEFKNGAKGTIQGSTSCWSTNGHAAEINICGDKGTVFMRDDIFAVWDFEETLPRDEKVKQELVKDTSKGLGANDPKAIDFSGHKQNFEDVIRALETGTSPMVTGEEALKAVELINAIYKSAGNNGQWIELS